MSRCLNLALETRVRIGKGVGRDPVHQVVEAVADPRWDFRTAHGIAKAVGIDERMAETVLSSHPELFRKSLVTDRNGRELFTLRERPVRWQERLALAGTLFAGNRRPE